jgi:hypothetical protein
MGDGNARPKGGQRAAQGARCIPLDNEQGRRLDERSEERFGDMADVAVRIGGTRAIEARAVIAAETEIGRIESGMLSGQDEARLQTECGEAGGDWRELDRFGPRADDQPDIRAPQISP